MKYSYFPGCSMGGSAIEYQKSLNYVNSKIGVELLEIPDWNCCGATAAQAVSRELALALPARNLALCEGQGLGLPLAVACAACYARLKAAARAARDDAAKMQRLLEMPLTGDVPIVSLMEVYAEQQACRALAAAIQRPLNQLKVACYYGCLYTRPTEVSGGKNAEDPQYMEELLALAGAAPVAWDFTTECCGAAHHVDMPEFCRPLLRDIYQNAREHGAQAIVTACPLCMMNLDMRQKRVNQEFHENFHLPVFFFTELLALALGASVKEAGIASHFTPAAGLFSAAREVL